MPVGRQDTTRVVVAVYEVRVLVLVVVSQYSRNLPCLKSLNFIRDHSFFFNGKYLFYLPLSSGLIHTRDKFLMTSLCLDVLL